MFLLWQLAARGAAAPGWSLRYAIKAQIHDHLKKKDVYASLKAIVSSVVGGSSIVVSALLLVVEVPQDHVLVSPVLLSRPADLPTSRGYNCP